MNSSFLLLIISILLVLALPVNAGILQNGIEISTHDTLFGPEVEAFNDIERYIYVQIRNNNTNREVVNFSFIQGLNNQNLTVRWIDMYDADITEPVYSNLCNPYFNGNNTVSNCTVIQNGTKTVGEWVRQNIEHINSGNNKESRTKMINIPKQNSKWFRVMVQARWKTSSKFDVKAYNNDSSIAILDPTFDNGWDSRRLLNVTNAQVGDVLWINITAAGITCSETNCTDIRVTNLSDNIVAYDVPTNSTTKPAGQYLVLPLTTGISEFYIYYSKAGATSSKVDFVVWEDDFEAGVIGTVPRAKNQTVWNVAGGTAEPHFSSVNGQRGIVNSTSAGSSWRMALGAAYANLSLTFEKNDSTNALYMAYRVDNNTVDQYRMIQSNAAGDVGIYDDTDGGYLSNPCITGGAGGLLTPNNMTFIINGTSGAGGTTLRIYTHNQTQEQSCTFTDTVGPTKTFQYIQWTDGTKPVGILSLKIYDNSKVGSTFAARTFRGYSNYTIGSEETNSSGAAKILTGTWNYNTSQYGNGTTSFPVAINISVYLNVSSDNISASVDRVFFEINNTFNHTASRALGGANGNGTYYFQFTMNSSYSEGNLSIELYANTTDNATMRNDNLSMLTGWVWRDVTLPTPTIGRTDSMAGILRGRPTSITINFNDSFATNWSLTVYNASGDLRSTYNGTANITFTYNTSITDIAGNWSLNLTARDLAYNSRTISGWFGVGSVTITDEERWEAGNFTSIADAWGNVTAITNGTIIDFDYIRVARFVWSGLCANCSSRPQFSVANNFTSGGWDLFNVVKNDNTTAANWTVSTNTINITSDTINDSMTREVRMRFRVKNSWIFALRPDGASVLWYGIEARNVSTDVHISNAFVRIQTITSHAFDSAIEHSRYNFCTAGINVTAYPATCSTLGTAIDLTDTNNGNNGVINLFFDGPSNAVTLRRFMVNMSDMLFRETIEGGATTQAGGGGIAGGGGAGGGGFISFPIFENITGNITIPVQFKGSQEDVVRFSMLLIAVGAIVLISSAKKGKDRKRVKSEFGF